MLTHLDWSSLIDAGLSLSHADWFLLLSSVDCPRPLCVSLRQPLSLGSFFQLSDWRSLTYIRSRPRSRVQTLCLVSRQNRQRDRLLVAPLYSVTGYLLYIDQLILLESKTRRKKCSYGVDSQEKGIRYGPTKLDIRQSQNVQDIQCYKVYRGSHEKLESATDCRRKKLAEMTIQRGIFHRDALSQLLFVIGKMLLNHILRKCTIHISQKKSDLENETKTSAGFWDTNGSSNLDPTTRPSYSQRKWKKKKRKKKENLLNQSNFDGTQLMLVWKNSQRTKITIIIMIIIKTRRRKSKSFQLVDFSIQPDV